MSSHINTRDRTAVPLKAPAHTPGPWIADDIGMENGQLVRVGTHDGSPNYYHTSLTICQCRTSSGSEDVYDADDEDPPLGQAEANARLIAAAPDLLAAILCSDDAHWTTAMRAAVKKALRGSK